MCQVGLLTECELIIMFCSRYISNIKTNVREPFKHENILNFFLLMSDEAVF